jgi:hypothetical protein
MLVEFLTEVLFFVGMLRILGIKKFSLLGLIIIEFKK